MSFLQNGKQILLQGDHGIPCSQEKPPALHTLKCEDDLAGLWQLKSLQPSAPMQEENCPTDQGSLEVANLLQVAVQQLPEAAKPVQVAVQQLQEASKPAINVPATVQQLLKAAEPMQAANKGLPAPNLLQEPASLLSKATENLPLLSQQLPTTINLLQDHKNLLSSVPQPPLVAEPEEVQPTEEVQLAAADFLPAVATAALAMPKQLSSNIETVPVFHQLRHISVLERFNTVLVNSQSLDCLLDPILLDDLLEKERNEDKYKEKEITRKLFEEFHYTPIGRHGGITRTLTRIATIFVCPTLVLTLRTKILKGLHDNLVEAKLQDFKEAYPTFDLEDKANFKEGSSVMDTGDQFSRVYQRTRQPVAIPAGGQLIPATSAGKNSRNTAKETEFSIEDELE